jgi:predicted nuclease of predicted toxin-antitoxin system
MNFVADESIDRQIVNRLQQEGHRVFDVTEMSPGISDDEVLSKANKESAILLTADRDFGDLVFRQGRLIEGVVLIRLAGLSSKSKADHVSAAINHHGKELKKAFSVITPGSIRIRKSSSS